MNSTKRPSTKQSRASKNTVGVQVANGMIRLCLPRSISRNAYGKDQKYVSPGLKATPLNIKIMEGKASQMSGDIATGNFDVTLAKYELGVTEANKLVSIDGGKKAELTLKELWDKYLEYKRGNKLAVSTLGKAYRTYTNTISKTSDKMSGLEVRQFVINRHESSIAKRLLQALSKCYEWGKQHGLVNGNPFTGMAEDIEVVIQKKVIKSLEGIEYNQQEDDYRAFTREERDAIIEEFYNNSRIRHYADYVKFLFYTGCRSGEAEALRWKHISNDFRQITFCESYYSELKHTNSTTKTKKPRTFRVGDRLRELLVSIKPIDAKPDDLVFTSKEGNQINHNRFKLTWIGNPNSRYPGVIPRLIKEGKVSIYLKPYATRHTFITLQLEAGSNIQDVAKQCGNSAGTIVSHYASATRDLILKEV